MRERILRQHGITVDAGAISRGVWAMLTPEDRAPFVWGMCPIRVAEMLERMIREKIESEYKRQHGWLPDLDATYAVGGADLRMEETASYREFIREIMREIHCGLLEAATAAGVCQV